MYGDMYASVNCFFKPVLSSDSAEPEGPLMLTCVSRPIGPAVPLAFTMSTTSITKLSWCWALLPSGTKTAPCIIEGRSVGGGVVVVGVVVVGAGSVTRTTSTMTPVSWVVVEGTSVVVFLPLSGASV